MSEVVTKVMHSAENILKINTNSFIIRASYASPQIFQTKFWDFSTTFYLLKL